MLNEPHQLCTESIAYVIPSRLIKMGEADDSGAVLLLYDNHAWLMT